MSTPALVDGTSTAATLVEVLRHRAQAHPDRRVYTFLADDLAETARLTYGDLDLGARALAATLEEAGARGTRALLLFPPGLDYVRAFFACLYAGVVAVPAYPPAGGRAGRGQERLLAIARDARPAFALTGDASSRGDAGAIDLPDLGAIRWIVTDTIDARHADAWTPAAPDPAALAFLQYTSGSTATPKGVMVTHANLLHNQRVIQTGCDHTEQSTFVGWLPMYHDMGLIGNVLQPMFIGAHAVLMAPAHFLRRPANWLHAITRYAGRTSGGPNFAYDLCTSRVTEEDKASLDLRSWSIAFNGAEPVSAETLDRFAAAFAPCGFRREAFYPCYGLAECTLMAAGGRRDAGPVVKRVQAAALEQHVARDAEPGDAPVRTLVGCGRALLDQSIEIVDPQTGTPCPDGQVGEIWMSSPSVTAGYWGRPEESARVCQASLAGRTDTFLRTGDLGLLDRGELFITGRAKDLIIVRGRNLYPQDLESTAERAHAAVRRHASAAFAIDDRGGEALAIVCEVERRLPCEPEIVIDAIRLAIAEEHGVRAQAVALIPAQTLPMTTSGKVQRAQCRASFLAGTLAPVACSVLKETPASEAAAASAASDRDRLTAAMLLEVQPELRLDLLLPHLRTRIAPLMGAAFDRWDETRSLVSLGLDSLRAHHLAQALEDDLSIAISPVDLLNGLTLRELALVALERLGRSASDGAAASPSPSALAETDDASTPAAPAQARLGPLSHGQRALWFLHRVSPETNSAYTLASAISLPPDLDVARFRDAWRAIVLRHPMLRTTFAMVDGEPVRQAETVTDAWFDELTTGGEAGGGDRASLVERLVREAGRPFDLQHGPVFQVQLVREPAGGYVALLRCHHIAADLWSLETIVHELDALYRHPQASLPPLASSYDTFVHWQAGMLASDVGAQHWAYWSRQLAGAPFVLDLPADHPRPSVASYRGASIATRLDRDLTHALRDLARAQGVTLFALAAALTQLLLHRYSGQDDLLLGCPTAGRPRPEFADVVGYFVNPVVLRSDISRDPPFTTYLRQTHRTALDASAHQDYPFALLVERLQPPREASRSPVFQAALAWQQERAAAPIGLAALALGEADAPLRLDTLKASGVPLPRQAAQFDLTVMLAETDDGLAASWRYSTDLFERPTIARMARRFEALARAAVADPSRCVLALSLVDPLDEPSSVAQAAQAAQAGSLEYRRSIHDVFEDVARRTPQADALVCADGRLSFAALNQRANQLAHRLRAMGVGPETVVAHCLTRGLDAVVAILGIWKAGGAYLPLDSRDPHARLARLLTDSRAEVLLTHSSLVNALPERVPRAILLDLEADDLAEEPGGNPAGGARPANLAYLIATSGSTGTPKLVAIEHRSVMNLLACLCYAFYDEHPPGPLRVGLNASLTFDASVKQLITLALGHTLHVVPDDVRRDARALLDFISTQQLDLLDCTPSQLAFLLDAGFEPERSGTTLFLGGEPIPERMWQRLQRTGACNLYGPTECTVDATFCRVRDSARPVLGTALRFTPVHLLDAHLQPVPIDIPGELAIGGASVARGYVGQPALTAERFVPDPLSATPGARMYRSRDLARRGPTGDIAFLGRLDRQMKVRGIRVEPGEIEAALRSVDDVQDCAVLLTRDGAAGGALQAYVTSRDGAPLSAASLRRALAQQLPDYMIPSAFIPIAQMPLTASGKRNDGALLALPIPLDTRVDSRPLTAVEEWLAELWGHALGVSPVLAHDNFFELGGHSLQATQLLSQIQDLCPTEIPLLTSFFQNPTVEALAAALTDDPGGPAHVAKIEAMLHQAEALAAAEDRQG
jgi:amino acid adenylation domain-containing protein